VHHYRSVATRAVNSTLREGFEELGGETLRHVEILEELIGVGGNPAYLSPSAPATEARASRLLDSTFLLAGSIPECLAFCRKAGGAVAFGARGALGVAAWSGTRASKEWLA
jgi:hypothetical protein